MDKTELSTSSSVGDKRCGFHPEISERMKNVWKERLSSVVNRAYIRKWALDYANDKRFHKFSRVSESFLAAIETATKNAIRDRIDRHPSKGVTLQ